MNQELSKQIVAAVNATSGATGKAGELIRQAVSEDADTLVDVAVQIELKNPNRQERNNKLSILRMQVRRACAALNMEQPLSVKKIKGRWQLSKVEPRPVDVVAAQKLEREVADVLEHIAEPSVLDKLREPLIALGWMPPTSKPTAAAKRRAQAAASGASLQ